MLALDKLKKILDGCTWTIVFQSNFVINFYIKTSPQSLTSIELALHEWARMLPAMWGIDVYLPLRDITTKGENKINLPCGYYELDDFEEAINDYRNHLCTQITTICDTLINTLKESNDQGDSKQGS